MQILLISMGIVALAEMGDKTQLLALVLAARFRKPVPIILGMLAATVLNHGFAGAVGAGLTHALGPVHLKWLLACSFIAMAVWTLVPDKLDAEEEKPRRFGVFGTTVIAFFMAEMGDKTQFATIALTARFHAYWPVVTGTTIGMMLVNVPVVLLGDRFARRLPIRLIHGVAALIFLLLGVALLLH